MKIFLFLYLLLIYACSSEKKELTIDYKPISKATDKAYDSKDSIQEKPSVDVTMFNQNGIQLGVINADTLTQLHFLDRFAKPENRSKFSLTTTKANCTYFRWDFRDSLHRKTAMYNWLDHYGDKNLSLDWLGNKKLSPENLLILLNSHSIIEVKSTSKIDLNRWTDFQKINFSKDSLRYIIEQPAGKKCKWFISNKNKLQPCLQLEVSTDPI